MDLALNNLQRLIYHKPNQPTNQPTNATHPITKQLTFVGYLMLKPSLLKNSCDTI